MAVTVSMPRRGHQPGFKLRNDRNAMPTARRLTSVIYESKLQDDETLTTLSSFRLSSRIGQSRVSAPFASPDRITIRHSSGSGCNLAIGALVWKTT